MDHDGVAERPGHDHQHFGEFERFGGVQIVHRVCIEYKRPLILQHFTATEELGRLSRAAKPGQELYALLSAEVDFVDHHPNGIHDVQIFVDRHAIPIIRLKRGIRESAVHVPPKIVLLRC